MTAAAARTYDLTTAPLGGLLWKLALPALGSNVIQPLNASINAVWIGRFVGEAGLAATANATLVLFLLLNLTFGFTLATTILTGQALGAKDLPRARKTVATGLSLITLAALSIGTIGFFTTSSLLTWLGTPAQAHGLAEAYLRTVFLALPAMAGLSFVSSVLSGAGDTRSPFYVLIFAMALDALLNPVLILGLGPAPALGIAGSGVALLVSQTIGLIGLIVLVYRRRSPLALGLTSGEPDWPQPRLLRPIASKGVFLGLQGVIFYVSAVLIISVVNRYGAGTAAAYGVATQLWTYIQMPAMAISVAISALAAQCVGAGLTERLGAVARLGLISCTGLTLALIGAFHLLEGPALSLFLPMNSESFEVARHINAIVLWSFVLYGVTLMLFSVIRASGVVVPQLVILTISLLVVRVCVAELASPSWGPDAIWWSFPIGSAVSALLAAAYYRHGRWRPVVSPPAGLAA